MNSELLNLALFVYAIAKVLAMTGLGLAGVVVVMAECCGFRICALGLEKVRGEQLATLSDRVSDQAKSWASSSPRKARVA